MCLRFKSIPKAVEIICDWFFVGDVVSRKCSSSRLVHVGVSVVLVVARLVV